MAINHSRAAAIVLFLFGALFYYIAESYPAEAASFPKALLLGLIFFSGLLFFRSYHFDLYKGHLVIQQKKQVLLCTGLAVLYVLSIPYIGYYISSTLFILAISLALQFRSKLIPIIVAVAFPLAIYLVFEILLKIPVPGISL